MSKWKWIVLIVWVSVLAVPIEQLYFPANPVGQPITVTINPGTSTSDIIRQLQSHGLVGHTGLVKLYFKISGLDRRLHSGIFTLDPRDSAVTTLKKLSAAQTLIKVTIPEGYSLKKMATVLENKTLLPSAQDFLVYVRTQAKSDFENEFRFLKDNPILSLEGYLYPSTYYFAYGTHPQIIVRTMLQAFDRHVYRQWEVHPGGAGSLKARFSFHQVLTFASIVEKEARLIDEMPTIASVYNNRLKRRMRLEADPTVLYALGEPDKKRVLYRDLEVDSPYNTYRRFGLPPGPIASPGALAMTASLDPAKTPYFYFVAHPQTGAHIFSKTFAEHSRNVKRMRRLRNK